MDSITRTGCKLVLNEVHEGEIDGFVERGDAYFALMPNPDSEREQCNCEGPPPLGAYLRNLPCRYSFAACAIPSRVFIANGP